MISRIENPKAPRADNLESKDQIEWNIE
jgi:hypothetical protein